MPPEQPPHGACAAALLTLCEGLRRRDYHFVAVTPATHGRVNARPENRLARGLRDVFGWNRPFLRDTLDPELFDAALEAGILCQTDLAGQACWRSTMRAATLRGHVFLHSGFPTAAPDAVFFGPDTYRFIDAVERELAGRANTCARVVDIGCGSGAAGIVIALARPEAGVFLTDINEAALAVSGVNAASCGVANIVCARGDLFADLGGVFDLIVANPPYLIDPARRTYRHGGGHLGEGLSLRILGGSLERLAPGGRLILYSGSAIVRGHDALLHEAGTILSGAGWRWTYREADPDVFGDELDAAAYGDADRIAAVVLTAERPA